MTLSSFGLALLLPGLLLFSSQQRTPLVVVHSVPVAPDVRVLDAAWIDLDGDRLPDLILALAPRTAGARRSLAVYRQVQGRAGLPATPTQRFDLPGDVLAFAVADLDPAPGKELALITPGGAYALRPEAPEAERFVRLGAVDCLWQLPDPEQLKYWSRAVSDLDADGLDDLLVPTDDGYALLIQRREGGVARFEPSLLSLLPLRPLGEGQAPLKVTSASASSTVELRLAGPLGVAPLVNVEDSVPAPFLLDADGDRFPELLAQDATQLQWFAGSRSGPTGPAASEPAPVIVDERRALDVSFASLMGDINGDGRLDWVLLAGDQLASKARTQILIHHQQVPTPQQPRRFLSTPDAVLVIDGFVGDPRLYDVNGDGRIDLSLAALRPDLMQALSQGSTDRYELEQYLYLNEGGKLARRPILAERLTFNSEENLPTLEFVKDRSGDGVADLFWRPSAGKLRLSMVNTRGDRWSLVQKPLFELSIDPKARLITDSVDGRGASAPILDHLIALGPREVSVLEF